LTGEGVSDSTIKNNRKAIQRRLVRWQQITLHKQVPEPGLNSTAQPPSLRKSAPFFGSIITLKKRRSFMFRFSRTRESSTRCRTSKELGPLTLLSQSILNLTEKDSRL